MDQSTFLTLKDHDNRSIDQTFIKNSYTKNVKNQMRYSDIFQNDMSMIRQGSTKNIDETINFETDKSIINKYGKQERHTIQDSDLQKMQQMKSQSLDDTLGSILPKLNLKPNFKNQKKNYLGNQINSTAEIGNSSLSRSKNFSNFSFIDPNKSIYNNYNNYGLKKLQEIKTFKMNQSRELKETEEIQKIKQKIYDNYKNQINTLKNMIKERESQLNKNQKNIKNDAEIFTNNYKSLDRIMEQDIADSQETSPMVNFIKIQREHHFLPNKMGIFKTKEKTGYLNLKNSSIEDKKLEIMNQVIRKDTTIKNLNLSNNQITDIGAEKFLQSIMQNLEIIDLSNNKIGYQATKSIENHLAKPDCLLQKLILKGNNLKDKNIKNILNGVLINRNTLQVLNLTDNKLSDQCCDLICEILEEKMVLKELYLGWNNITSTGSEAMFSSLCENFYLQVFDISHNNIGKDIFYLLEFIKNNTTVQHLDLSFNQINREQSIEVADNMRNNQSIIGFHYQGMYGIVDNLGFLQIEQEIKNFESPIQKPIEGMNILVVNKIKTKNIHDFNQKDNICWICQGWQHKQYIFDYEYSINNEAQQDYVINDDSQIFLHFEFDNYVGRTVAPFKKYDPVEVTFVVPNKEFYFFFSIDGQFCLNKKINIIKFKKMRKIQYSYQGKEIYIETMKMNINTLKNNQEQQKNTRLYVPQESFKIRTAVMSNARDHFRKIRKIWKVQDSYIKPSREDIQELYINCLEYDFERNKIPKMVKNPADLIEYKETLLANYKEVKDSYRHYCFWDIMNENIGINFIQIQQLLQEANIPMTESELFAKIQAGMHGQQRSQSKTEIVLQRPQLVELLVRMSDHKLFKIQTEKSSLSRWLKNLLTHLQENCQIYDLEEWRNNTFLTESTDYLFIFYKKATQEVFESHSSKNFQKGVKQSITVQDAISICSKLYFTNIAPHVQEKDIIRLFFQSQVLYTDENDNNRLRLNYQEFLEFIGRLANLLCLPNEFISIDHDDMNERNSQTFFQKLESFFTHLLKQKHLFYKTNIKYAKLNLWEEFQKVKN